MGVIEDPHEIAELVTRGDASGPSRKITDVDGVGRVVRKPCALNDAVTELRVPSATKLQDLAEQRGIPWNSAYGERVVMYWGSDERVDADGDIVRQDGWDFSTFAKNSPLQYGHDWWSPPIGRMLDWEVRKRKDSDYKGPALLLAALFATEEQSAFADSVFRLVQARLMVSGSVGFFPKRIVDVVDDEERAELGLGPWGLVFEESELIEFSPVPIPANPGAQIAESLRAAKGLGLQGRDVNVLREFWRSEAFHEETDADRWVELESGVVALARVLWPDEEFVVHRDIEQPVVLDILEMETKEGDEETMDVLEAAVAVLDATERLTERFAEHAASVETVVGDVRALVERLERDLKDNKFRHEPVGETQGGSSATEELRMEVERLAQVIGV